MFDDGCGTGESLCVSLSYSLLFECCLFLVREMRLNILIEGNWDRSEKKCEIFHEIFYWAKPPFLLNCEMLGGVGATAGHNLTKFIACRILQGKLLYAGMKN